MRAAGVFVTTIAASALFTAGVASASAPIPFQIDPAPYGNPNGSFDAPSVRCVAVVGDEPGVVTITGGKEDGWGCLLSADVQWVNLSTGESGSARLSDGLNGIPAFAAIDTGAGQVAVLLTSTAAGPITPGIATFQVP
ncbi:MAG TPA: hypothetical protein VFN32_12015 [Rhodococcus sp. (in: high G+C Gram-positive bacteria)]|uniref:hypothetical protein n=1 Tax=Rhodococcus sp. SJ-3 TaxID=3454628 RepID=UPI002DA263AE|nr:hypothetical protein [Rhodococcus sp. (in: high G+C Gram-positive bacteria)]